MSHYCDGEYDSYVERIFVARTGHKCSACGRGIRKGDAYCRLYVLFDGRKETHKRCGSCQKTHEHLRALCAEVDDMWPDEDLGCGLKYEEEWGDVPDEIARMPLLSDAEASELLKRDLDKARAKAAHCVENQLKTTAFEEPREG